MKNVLLKIAYDGSSFHGWQRQPNLLTVQGEIERAISILCAKPIRIVGTSRTDKGVHGLGQVANFKGEFSIPVANIPRAANNLLNPAVQILEAKEVPMGFHSIGNTLNKTYRYEIINTKFRNPIFRYRAYFVDRKLNSDAMKECGKYIVGTRDFRCFQAAGGEEVNTTVRTINFLNVFTEDMETPQEFIKGDRKILSQHFDDEKIVVEINGDGFLYKMVRNIVGTMVEVGLGKMKPEDIRRAIDSRDRTLAGHTAPPQGLYLKEIFHEL